MRQKAEAIKKKIKNFKKRAEILYLDFALGFVFIALFLTFIFNEAKASIKKAFSEDD